MSREPLKKTMMTEFESSKSEILPLKLLEMNRIAETAKHVRNTIK